MDNVILKAAVLKIDSAISDIGELRNECTDTGMKSDLEYLAAICAGVQSKLLSFATEELDEIAIEINEIMSLEEAMSRCFDEDEDVESIEIV